MVYNNQNVKPVYWKQHADVFSDAYQYMWNQMAFIKDDAARVSATNCYMVSVTRALGMDVYGAVSLDEKDVVESVESVMKQFAQVSTDSGTAQGGLVPPARSQAPAQAQAPQKQQYGGQKQSGGRGMSPKQWETLTKFANSKNEAMKGTVYSFLANMGVADITELPAGEAYKLLQACFAILNADKEN